MVFVLSITTFAAFFSWTSAQVSCTPKAVITCKVCHSSGMAWIDDNSKCPSGQTCSDGVCITSQTSQKIDLLPYLIKSPDYYNYYLEWPRGNKTMHVTMYAANNDLSGATNIDMFWVKYNMPVAFEWWQYRASDQTIRHMFDIGDITTRNGRYNMTGSDNALGGPWLNRYMAPGQVISSWSPPGHWDFYNNTSPNFVPGQLNATADKFSENPTLYSNGNVPYKMTLGAAGRRDFGGDIGTVDFIQFYYQYPTDVYTINGTGTEVFTFGKGVGWIGWNMYNIDSAGKWTLENDQPLWIYKSAGDIKPAFSVVVPHPYVPAFAEYSPTTTGTSGNVSGKVRRNTGEGISGATIDLGNGQSAVTDSNGNWSAYVTNGSSYCVRLDSAPITGYTAVQATGNNSCHANAPSYEWQVAGQNQYSGCSYSDQRSWDLSSDMNFNFTVIYPTSSICTPNCTNKSCGDNGCGGSCGSCINGQTCSSGQCANQNQNITTVHCQAPCSIKMTTAHYASFVCYDYKMVCSGMIACNGKQCTCDDADCPKTCAPKTCQALNYNCGTAADGCGGTSNCGTCGTNQTCSANTCISTVCVPKTCATLGYNCGKTGDGCGNTLDCGNCLTNQTCTANVCKSDNCAPKTCAALGYGCGKTGDGCGATLDCGNCAINQECVNNACQASTLTQNTDNTDTTLASLYDQIEYLQSEIIRVTNLIKAKNSSTASCASISSNLFYGMKNDAQVKCLQQFLKSQGFFSASPTGNYYALTKNAVAAFQARYADELLVPYGLNHGSGNVDSATRIKINQLIEKNNY